MTEHSNLTDHNDVDYKSKTQIKNELIQLRKLGESLIDLPDGVYNTLSIPEKLDDAIKQAKKIASFQAKKRQLQYIGKVMRTVDMTEIEKKINDWQAGSKSLGREFKAIESLRERLIDNDTEVLNEIINAHPDCDIQRLRQLIRSTQKEQKLNKPPVHFRKLFRFLKEL